MRIIAGSARGRRLSAPAGRSLRPTPDRVREALFSILSGSVEGSNVLDLYAGTGAVGIEALSRGAAGAVFVERKSAHLRIIRANLEACGLARGARILSMTVTRALDLLGREGVRFDLIFADPPYSADRERAGALRRLAPGHLLRPGAWVVLEHPARGPIPQASPLDRVRTARYGDSGLSFFRIPAPAEPRRGSGARPP